MRQTILLSLSAILAVTLASQACAQRRGGFGPVRSGIARSGYGLHRTRAVSPRGFHNANLPYGFGYGYLPYDSGDAYPAYDSGAMYTSGPMYPYAPQPVVYVPPPAPPVQPPGHSVITEYTWPATSTVSSASQSEPQDFAIVLKDGSTLSAVSVFASDDGLHYIDPDERHMRVSMSQVDRTATLKLNRTRNLDLYLPAAQ
jgi:hypothetical protein